MKIELEVPVKNTEDGARVRQALLNIFPDAVVEAGGEALKAESVDAENFRELLEKQRIRDTARQFLRKHVRGGILSFKINKQAAYAGKVNFAVVSHPMGEIEIKITPEGDESIDDFIEWLTEI